MNTHTPIVVTGLGCISSVGNTTSETWTNIKDGYVGIGPSKLLDVNQLKAKYIAEVDYVSENYFSSKETLLLDRFTQFALIAAEQAIDTAKLQPHIKSQHARIGIIMGTGVGARNTNDEALYQFYDQKKKIPPISIPKGLFHAPVSFISMKYGITGPAFMTSSACASANHAMSMAINMIRTGVIDIAITGGTDAPITLPFYKGWEALRIMDTDITKPFSANRNGFNLGEGAGVLILENLNTARSRNANIMAYCNGYGMSSDAGDLIKMSEAGVVQALQNCLNDAGINPSQIDYINAHGTGTVLNDKTETAAIKQVFGKHASNLSISSTKSMHGHTLGASGAIEAVITMLAIQHGSVPPTMNLRETDPDCDLDYTPNRAIEKDIKYALSNSFAFGGANCVLAFSKAN